MVARVSRQRECLCWSVCSNMNNDGFRAEDMHIDILYLDVSMHGHVELQPTKCSMCVQSMYFLKSAGQRAPLSALNKTAILGGSAPTGSGQL